MDRLRASSVPHDYDPMYSNLSVDSRSDRAFGVPPSAFPKTDPSVNLAGAAGEMLPMEGSTLPNQCVCGTYSMGVGRHAPGLQTAPPTQKLKATDSWGVPVRVGREGTVMSREKKGSSRAGSSAGSRAGSSRAGSRAGSGRSSQFSVAKANEPYSCLMIAHCANREAQESVTGGQSGCYMALSRYNGEYKFMDRNQSGWNITAFNRPHQTDRYTRSSPEEVAGYEELAEWGREQRHLAAEGNDAMHGGARSQDVVLPSGTYRWGEYGQWVITIDFHKQVAVTYYEEQPVAHWQLKKGVAQKSNRRQFGQVNLAIF